MRFKALYSRKEKGDPKRITRTIQRSTSTNGVPVLGIDGKTVVVRRAPAARLWLCVVVVVVVRRCRCRRRRRRRSFVRSFVRLLSGEFAATTNERLIG